jgi:hypothetical protein
MTSAIFGWRPATVALLVAAMVPAQFAAAQNLEELDRLALASAKPKTGLALAGSQAASGALLDALATLERVLMVDPKNKPARLLHASILCRIDDRDGAGAEFAKLKSGDFKKAEWAAARAPCASSSSGGSGR